MDVAREAQALAPRVAPSLFNGENSLNIQSSILNLHFQSASLSPDVRSILREMAALRTDSGPQIETVFLARVKPV